MITIHRAQSDFVNPHSLFAGVDTTTTAHFTLSTFLFRGSIGSLHSSTLHFLVHSPSTFRYITNLQLRFKKGTDDSLTNELQLEGALQLISAASTTLQAVGVYTALIATRGYSPRPQGVLAFGQKLAVAVAGCPNLRTLGVSWASGVLAALGNMHQITELQLELFGISTEQFEYQVMGRARTSLARDLRGPNDRSSGRFLKLRTANFIVDRGYYARIEATQDGQWFTEGWDDLVREAKRRSGINVDLVERVGGEMGFFPL